jgi:ADP-heptose:LPS heptosyltransferase
VIIVALVEHMGDIVAAEPIFRALRRAHPDALIVHVVGEKWRVLTSQHPDIDQQQTVRCLSEWYLASGRTGAIEYDLHVPGRVCDVCRSVTRPTAAATPGIDISNYYQQGSLLDVFARVGGVDLMGIDRQPRLHLPPQLGNSADSTRRSGLGPRYAVIHAASNQAHRDWTSSGWRLVIEALREDDLPVAEVGLGPTLNDLGAIDRTGQPLSTTIDLIRGAELFLGVDSGPAHIANALGVPAIVLMGHYGVYQQRMPFSGGLADGSGGIVIQHDGPLAELSPQVVIDAARSMLRKVETGTA